MNMKQLHLFWFWINERYQIYLNRKNGLPWPWTKDKILQTYKFTNVFRQTDRVTVDLLENVVNSPKASNIKNAKKRLEVTIFNIIKYRMFNWPGTYKRLGGFSAKWDERKAIAILRKMQANKEQVFTGAYIITNNGLTEEKIVLVCRAVTKMYKDRKKLAKEISEARTVEHWVYLLSQYDMVGPFIAYELATDIRHLDKVKLLETAYDKDTWANPGPGARRGLNRIYGREVTATPSKKQLIEEMHDLLKMAGGYVGKKMPRLEMRDIEHSLCEFDKYMRVKQGEGRPRSKYRRPEEVRRGKKKAITV